ncbi:ATP-dependent metallopeptidase FtsH/Yme1/Tma family protein, partial [Microvirga roseola]|uniref:ATP-dependent metallopeptidase FtsH/Yme1/Tma family protein n=1 Tax=Microvirga roseola TaxID=2883126 RepID=UPI0038991BCD
MTFAATIPFVIALTALPPQAKSEAVPYSDFVAAVERDEVSAVRVQGQIVEGERVDGRSIETYLPQGANIVPLLHENNVEIVAYPPPQPSVLGSLLAGLFPLLLIFGLFFFLARRAANQQGGAGGLMSVGKSKA